MKNLIKLKNKTNLRNRILNNYYGIQTTDCYTKIVIDWDGSINYWNQSVICSDRFVFQIQDIYEYFSSEDRPEVNKKLTRWFKKIESILNGEILIDRNTSILDLLED